MDLVAEMLLYHLFRDHGGTVETTRVRPGFARVFSRLPNRFGNIGFKADRLLNRMWCYPHVIRSYREEFELFHIIDHSYAHLAQALPSERTVVTCHDLDALQCILQPGVAGVLSFRKAIAERVLTGLRRATRVVCDSEAVRQQIVSYGLLLPERVAVIPNGVHPSCSRLPDPAAESEAARLLRIDGDAPCILHVGSTSRRKRIDLLLRIFERLLRHFPNAKLVHAGGALTPDQARLAAQLNLEDSIHTLPFLSRSVLAAIYRRSALLLLPSDAEGFGLPVIESLACGTPVVATDLPVLREVGGVAVTYCALGDIPAWVDAAISLLRERSECSDQWQARIRAGTKRASTFTWAEHARKLVALYEELLSSLDSPRFMRKSAATG